MRARASWARAGRCSTRVTSRLPTRLRRLPRRAPTPPAFLVYTSGSTGEPKAAVYPRSYIRGNWLQTVRWMGVRPADRVWCTAGTGWAKSLRNAWLAPWLRGAETVVHEGALRSRTSGCA